MPQNQRNYDVLIIGAGLSGVGAAHYLNKNCPDLSYLILEGRDSIGGTWDLFKYPGVRSDSDMYTLGYGFRPWRRPKAIVQGSDILDYIQTTAKSLELNQKIEFNRWVRSASWSSKDSRWTVRTAGDNGELAISCKFLWVCAGYYKYSSGYVPHLPGIEQFSGVVIHPQHWPPDLDYSNKNITVIGSGATAISLIPALTKKAQHVTMLQRSPTYLFSMPSSSWLASNLNKVFPASLVYWIIRWQRILFQQIMYMITRTFPKNSKKRLIKILSAKITAKIDIEKHFTPNYMPWDQRICLIADDDFTETLNSGASSIVTDEIIDFCNDGIKLKSGERIKADIVVTATGLDLEWLGGINLFVDEKPIDIGRCLTYKGVMYSGVPNLVSTFGYTNASWTLRSDLISVFVCRLLKYMQRKSFASVTPQINSLDKPTEPFLDFTSGYVKRASHKLPKQGSKSPWRHPQNFAKDLFNLQFAPINDSVLHFSSEISQEK